MGIFLCTATAICMCWFRDPSPEVVLLKLKLPPPLAMFVRDEIRELCNLSPRMTLWSQAQSREYFLPPLGLYLNDQTQLVVNVFAFV
jgi:hypothetical protein